MKWRIVGFSSMLLVLALLAMGRWSSSTARARPLENVDVLFAHARREAAAALAAARHLEGERASERAIRLGYYKVYQVGLPAPGYGDYRELLRSRYGVVVENVGCMQVANRADWEDGFTDATKRYLLNTHGRDVFEECWREARRRYEARVKCE